MRGLFSPWSNIFILRECKGFNPGVVDIEDGVPGREQVECGREEVEDGEKRERDKHEETDKEQPTKAQAHIMDDMRMK